MHSITERQMIIPVADWTPTNSVKALKAYRKVHRPAKNYCC